MTLGHQVVETVLLQLNIKQCNFWLRIPFSIWWRLVVSVNNMEDVIGGHIWVGVYVSLVVFGIFSLNHLLGHVVLCLVR
jgi:hypothetical protein